MLQGAPCGPICRWRGTTGNVLKGSGYYCTIRLVFIQSQEDREAERERKGERGREGGREREREGGRERERGRGGEGERGRG